MMGANVKRLIAQKMATDAVPKGGGLADALAFVSRPQVIVEGARKATEFVMQAIAAVRQAGEPNPWKDADDETIAAEILRQIAERKK